MTRLYQSLLLVGTILVWAESVGARETTSNNSTASMTTGAMTASTVHPISATNTTQNTETPTPTDATLTTNTTSSKATTTTSVATTTNRATTTTSASRKPRSKDNKESDPERIGSMAVAGLILIFVGLLLMAVNGYVFCKPKMRSCSTKSGIFHVLPMSAIKKKRSNDTDDDNDVEDNFKEEADVTPVDIKDGPSDETPGQNGQVQTKADVIAEPSTDITGPTTDIAGPSTVIEVGVEAAENANADPVVDESKKPEEEVEKSKETVITVEGGADHQNEQP